MRRKTLRLLDVTIDNVTRAEALALSERFLAEKTFHHIVTPGPEFLLEATAHPRFRDILNRADLSLPDGMGIHIGARMTGQRLVNRIPGVDYVEDLLSLAAKQGLRVFLFGGRPGIAEKAAQHMMRRFHGLQIVGTESGSRGSWTTVYNQRIIERIHLAKPDILLVALGAPKQELWIDDHRHHLHTVSIAVGVGRTLDYFAGAIRRAPAPIRKTGFEWLYTYLTAAQYFQPQLRRRRVTNATYRFVIELIRHRYAKRV